MTGILGDYRDDGINHKTSNVKHKGRKDVGTVGLLLHTQPTN